MPDGFRGLRLYNTLTRTKEDFRPLDWANLTIPDAEKRVRMYVCGPTVYDYAHIGNARPAIVFDVLFRLLRHLYGDKHVTYVRNITDVDDKINARALRDYGAEIEAGKLSLNEAIRKVTEPTYEQYQKDVTALGCLPPTFQPRATEFVLPRADGKSDMVTLIQSLIDRGHAYVSNGEVLFDVASMADYGQLSKRPLDEQQAGARIAVDAHKKNPADFVLWKESSADEPGWQATFRISDDNRRALGLPSNTVAIRGRPGWHIECSAMSAAYLGDVFDIHGGGLDLIFPHHENEIAQSRCAHGTEVMANYWLHNGFLQVEGKKMSKSDGNFVTIHELLETEKFGGRKWRGPVIRLAMLMTHYREPIDFSVRRIEEAEFIYNRLSEVAHSTPDRIIDWELDRELNSLFIDDIDTSSSISLMNSVAKKSNISRNEAFTIYNYTRLLGIKFDGGKIHRIASRASSLLYEIYKLSPADLELIQYAGNRDPLYKSGRLRPEAELFSALKALEKFSARSLGGVALPTLTARIRNELNRQRNKKSKSTRKLMTFLEFINDRSEQQVSIQAAVARRLAFIQDKNWPEADRIRDELLAQGIQLKDGKDPTTGERITTWEVKR